VLFDEIEKAAASMTRLLLGVLDKATLKLGDNTTVDFQRSLIFLTSNIGARAMERQLRPAFGFPSAHDNGGSKLQDVALASAKRHFSPEFINRMDSIVTYQPLPYECLERILDREIVLLQRHIDTQLGSRRFDLHVDKKARKFLLERGCSPEYGARELKRVMTRELTQPLAETVAEDNIRPGSEVCATVRSCGTRLRLRARVLSVLRRSERP
jgi:ATP-dependent Clp protease ATP-binding subunit ClpA